MGDNFYTEEGREAIREFLTSGKLCGMGTSQVEFI